jgi:hypothetical protein
LGTAAQEPLLASPTSGSNGAGANTDLLGAYAVVAGLTATGFILSRVRKVSIPWNS